MGRLHCVDFSISDKWLPGETVCMIVLPAKSLGRKQKLMDTLDRKPFIMYSSLSKKRKITLKVWAEAKYDSLDRKQELAD